jgi:hypothetical protein
MVLGWEDGVRGPGNRRRESVGKVVCVGISVCISYERTGHTGSHPWPTAPSLPYSPPHSVVSSERTEGARDEHASQDGANRKKGKDI